MLPDNERQGYVVSENYDVLIVGGGIVGTAAALELQMRGRRVAIIDPGDPRGRSSYGNGGVISRGSIFPMAGSSIWNGLLSYALGRSPAVRLRYRSLLGQLPWLVAFLRRCNDASWWEAAAPLNNLTALAFDAHMRLGAETGVRHLISRPGWIKVYRSQAAFDSSDLERRILAAKGVKTEILDPACLRALEPHLAPRFSHGIWFPETGTVDSPGQLMDAYHAAFRTRGGAHFAGKVDRLVQDEDGVRATTGGRTITAAYGVVAAGAWSAEFIAGLGYKIPFTAERGYHRHYRLPARIALNRPIYDTGGSYALVPMNGNVRLLSGVELAHPDDPANLTQLDSLVEDARATLSFEQPVPDSTWVGSRPSTPDGLPVIGKAPRHDRIVFAFGHGHIGFSTGPVTGQAVAALLANEAPPLDLAPFAIERFARRR